MRLACVWIVVLCFLPSGGRAFTIGSVFTDFCHEKITLGGFSAFVDEAQIQVESEQLDSIVGDPVWLQIAEYLEGSVKGIPTLNNAVQRMILITLFVGVRYPDQLGFSIVDLNKIRLIHLAENGQEQHALRGPDDDGMEGDIRAVERLHDYILATVDEARARFVEGTFPDQTEEVGFWIEYYGEIPIRVWKPLFLLALAGHALQDSFAHTYRSSDGMHIYAVANYLKGFDDDHDEAHDGPRHSDSLDACNHPDVQPLADLATQATAELFTAAWAYFKDEEDRHLVEEMLDKWAGYEPNCGFENAYCETPFSVIAKREETTSLLGCRATDDASHSLWWPGVFGLMGVGIFIRRERVPS